MTIRAVLIFNNYGNPRISKFYSHLPVDRQQALIQLIFQLVSRRDDKTVCNFLDAPELTPLLPPMTADAWSKASSAPLANAGISDSITSEDDADQNYDPWVTYSKTQPAPTKKTNTRWRPDDELRVIYRHYATLYFVLVVDQSESELGILDLIQVIVEALDQCFENVCELDLIFHFDQVHAIIDQVIQGGLVLDTNITEIVSGARAVLQARKASMGSGIGALGALGAAQNASAYLNPQSIMQQLGNVSLGSLAERGTSALGALQQAGNSYWSSPSGNLPRNRSTWM
ncbi:APS3 [Malassezia furfur]|nr:APS3 [Malassezia furfur]